MECAIFKVGIYTFFKIASSEKCKCHFEEIGGTGAYKPSLQFEEFRPQNDQSGRPVQTNGKCPQKCPGKKI